PAALSVSASSCLPLILIAVFGVAPAPAGLPAGEAARVGLAPPVAEVAAAVVAALVAAAVGAVVAAPPAPLAGVDVADPPQAVIVSSPRASSSSASGRRICPVDPTIFVLARFIGGVLPSPDPCGPTPPRDSSSPV